MQAWMELTKSPITAGRLYYSRPDQAFMRAFNQATFAQQTGKGITLAVVSSSFYAVEMLKRMSFKLDLAGTNSFNPQLFAEHMGQWAFGEMVPVDLFDLRENYNFILWAEPKVGSANYTLELLSNAALRGSELAIIVSSDYGFLFQSKTGRPKTKARVLMPGKTKVLLEEFGWKVDAVIGFDGPKAKLWNFLASKFIKTNNLHWSDRCYQMQQLKMREPGWLWPLSRLVLIRARWD